MNAPLISVRELTKTYDLGETQVHALRGVSLQVMPAGICARWTSRTCMGPSFSMRSRTSHGHSAVSDPLDMVADAMTRRYPSSANGPTWSSPASTGTPSEEGVAEWPD